jgi:hypothetical protein
VGAAYLGFENSSASAVTITAQMAAGGQAELRDDDCSCPSGRQGARLDRQVEPVHPEPHSSWARPSMKNARPMVMNRVISGWLTNAAPRAFNGQAGDHMTTMVMGGLRPRRDALIRVDAGEAAKTPSRLGEVKYAGGFVDRTKPMATRAYILREQAAD